MEPGARAALDRVEITPNSYRHCSTTHQDGEPIYHYTYLGGTVWLHLNQHGERQWFAQGAGRWMPVVGAIAAMQREYEQRRNLPLRQEV